MKRTVFILSLVLATVACGRKELFPDVIRQYSGEENRVKEDDPDDVDWDNAVRYVFDPYVIPEIHVSVSKEEWNNLLRYYDQNPDTQEYVKCDVLYRKKNEETLITGAGLRLKGNTSRRRPFENGKYRHVHFGINLHKYTGDSEHTIKGLRKFDLKWFKDDPAYVREIYCYDLFRRYGVWTGINDVYSRLWIKVGDDSEVYYGVYNLMEHIDKNYLRIRQKQFGQINGNLWKCSWGADLRNEWAGIGLDDNITKYAYELKTGTIESFDEAKAQLQEFITNVRELTGDFFFQWLSLHMDMDLFLKTYAVNVAVGMWDDYWNNQNNYYLYFTPGKDFKVWFIPYDYDNTLGTSTYCGIQSDSGRQDPYHWGQSNMPLMEKILQNPEWKARYKQYLQELCGEGGLFNYTSSVARIQDWQEAIKYYVSNDTGQDMTISDHPAYWGNHGEYRLLNAGSNNFFKVKSGVVAGME